MYVNLSRNNGSWKIGKVGCIISKTGKNRKRLHTDTKPTAGAALFLLIPQAVSGRSTQTQMLVGRRARLDVALRGNFTSTASLYWLSTTVHRNRRLRWEFVYASKIWKIWRNDFIRTCNVLHSITGNLLECNAIIMIINY